MTVSKITLMHDDNLNDKKKLLANINTCEMRIIAFNEAIKETKKRLFNICFVIFLILFVSMFYLSKEAIAGNAMSFTFAIDFIVYSVSLVLLGLKIKSILQTIKELKKNKKPLEIRLQQLRSIQSKEY